MYRCWLVSDISSKKLIDYVKLFLVFGPDSFKIENINPQENIPLVSRF